MVICDVCDGKRPTDAVSVELATTDRTILDRKADLCEPCLIRLREAIKAALTQTPKGKDR